MVWIFRLSDKNLCMGYASENAHNKWIWEYIDSTSKWLVLALSAAALFMLRDDSFLAGLPEEWKADFVDQQELAPLKLMVLKDRIRQRFPVSVSISLSFPIDFHFHSRCNCMPNLCLIPTNYCVPKMDISIAYGLIYIYIPEVIKCVCSWARSLKIFIHRDPLIKLISVIRGRGAVEYVGDAENCMFTRCCCILFSFRYNLMNYIINSYSMLVSYIKIAFEINKV